MIQSPSYHIAAILFAHDAPISGATLTRVLTVNIREVEGALILLAKRDEQSAIKLQSFAADWRLQLRTKDFSAAQAMSEVAPPRYSRAFWKILAHVAYHQPVNATRRAI